MSTIDPFLKFSVPPQIGDVPLMEALLIFNRPPDSMVNVPEVALIVILAVTLKIPPFCISNDPNVLT